jgi:hypothetical protein
MGINLKIPAHLGQKFPANLLLSILESCELVAEVQANMASLSFVGKELAGDILRPSQLSHPALEFRTPHHSMLGHFCPKLKRRC